MKAKDGIKIVGRGIVECFYGDYKTYEEAIRAEGKPYKVMESKNTALNRGMDQILTFLCGGTGTVFNAANARIGIGDNGTARLRTQTGLLAETVVCPAEINWVARPNVTSALDAVDRRVGANSVMLSVAAAFTTGIIATRDFAAMNLSAFRFVRLWIRSSVARAAGNLRLLLDNTAAGASPEETLSIPALSAGVWTQITLTLANPSLLTAIISVGIDATVSPGACIIHLDNIRAVTTWYRGMDTGHPTFGTEQRAIFRSMFAGAEANFPWREWTIDNGLADSPISLNRGVGDFGAKIEGQTRSFTGEIRLIPV
ncbi:MAG: hypothetical protein DDT42_00435 [candidate division WS2 bacterium]|uniref:Uncharacterized protein n=1 Tax=Psychracetigena formicireducens TaxID=2986056 RepID=A0A9E2BFE0_PSYF1|nr:hypothetical protein [Candidatus Psychracetigena formicireducens]